MVCPGERVDVVLVDDDRALAETTAAHLRRLDDRFEIAVETNADDAIERVHERSVDCIVSDYRMPGTDGIEFLETVHAIGSELPFILYTGEGPESVASDALSAGATDYLQKGSGTDRYELLANRIGNAVERYGADRRGADLERVRRLVRDVNRTLVGASDRDDLENRVCEILTGVDQYRFAWFGRVDEESDRVRPVAWDGLTESYFEDVAVTVDRTETGQGPGGRAIRNRRLEVSQDVGRDDTFEPWREAVEAQDARAIAAIPLDHEGTLYGLLVVAADRPYAFDDDEKTLLAQLADTIAKALDDIENRRALERERDRRSALFDNAHDPIVKSRFDETSAATVRGEPFPETPWWSHSPDLQSDVRSWLERAVDGELVRFEADHVGPEGGHVTIDRVLHPIRDEDETVISVLAAGRDISDRTERERALERQNERLEAFASIVSHDLRNPLTVAHGQVSLARDDSQAEHFETALDAIDRVEQITDGVLTMVRAGQAVEETDPVSLSAVANDSWDTVETGEATLEIVDDRTLAADRSRLRHVFENLFRNSIEHGTADRSGTRSNDAQSTDAVTVRVGPTERGFFVADDGTGLGLTIVREMILPAVRL